MKKIGKAIGKMFGRIGNAIWIIENLGAGTAAILIGLNMIRATAEEHQVLTFW